MEVICLILGAMRPIEFLWSLAFIILPSAYIAAVGVRVSLSTGSATRSMALTMGALIGTVLLVMLISVITTAVCALLWLIFWAGLQRAGVAGVGTRFWAPISFETFFNLVQLSMYTSLTLSIITESRVRFDQIAGRVAGGEIQQNVARWMRFQRRPKQDAPLSPATKDPCPPAAAPLPSVLTTVGQNGSAPTEESSPEQV
jgi:hypothetical protein